MNILIGYGTVAAFFVLVVVILERSHRAAGDFADFAVAGRSFGSSFQMMSFLNTWLAGTVFVSFAGMSAASGVIGYYLTFYSLLAIFFMLFMADKVFTWGKKFDLKTQADFVGMRYNSTPVRVVSALIGVITVFPWLVLGFQSLGLVFSYLSFGLVTPVQAVFVGIAVLAVRQIWTVRMGMRGIVISDMVQGIFAYGVGTTIALGLMVWLVGQGATLADLPSDFAKLPGPGSDLGPMYFFSIVLTGALGAWCWPDIFVRLFTARTASTIKRSAVKAAPVVVIFCAALLTLSMLASQLPEVAGAPDNVWFLTASHGGALVLALAGVCVLAATMGNANALNSAIGTHLAQDVIHVRGASDERMTRTAKLVILVVTVLAVIGATATATTTTGLVTLGLVSYQGVVAIYLGFAFLWPTSSVERARVDGLFEQFSTSSAPPNRKAPLPLDPVARV